MQIEDLHSVNKIWVFKIQNSEDFQEKVFKAYVKRLGSILPQGQSLCIEPVMSSVQ